MITYGDWFHSVKRLLKMNRPDLRPKDLDPGSAYRAYQMGVSPLDFVRNPYIVMRRPQANPLVHKLKSVKGGGVPILCVGVALVVYYWLIFDPSVEVPTTELMGRQMGGGRVNNLGLMADRQNGIIIGCAISLAGLLWHLFVDQKRQP